MLSFNSFVSWIAAGIVLGGLALAAGCRGGDSTPSASADGRFGSSAIPLDSPLVRLLGPLEGPYRLDLAGQPRLLVLRRQGDTEPFVLLGVRNFDDPEPDADPPPADAERRQWVREFTNHKRMALGELIGDRPLYLIRMSEAGPDEPSIVYLFMTESELADPAAPRGTADLVNALALRRGIANMELDQPSHPFRDLMLECQAMAVIEARRGSGAAPAGSIWNRFDLFVDPRVEEEIARIESSLR